DGRADGVDLVLGLEVEGQQRGVAADGSDLVIHLLQSSGRAADQDQVGALLGVGQGDGAADAASGTGDESEAVGEAARGRGDASGLNPAAALLARDRWAGETAAPNDGVGPFGSDTIDFRVGCVTVSGSEGCRLFITFSVRPTWTCPSALWPCGRHRRR